MSHVVCDSTNRTDKVLEEIAEYVCNKEIHGDKAYDTARLCLADTLGCGILALNFPECTKLLGPVVPGTVVPGGARVPGTPYILDPVQAAFNIGTMIRWLDYNDTWLAAEWGHPSDNLGGILAVCDYLCRQHKKQEITVKYLLTAMIKAHEIQGIIALENSFNRIGLDHVLLVKIATTAVVTQLLGGTKDQVIDAVSNAWIDGSPLRTYRHAPNTGSRKSWAAGDATSRGVKLAMMTLQGEMGYPSALSAPKWGFYDVYRKGQPFSIPRPYDSYVMENVLFKIAYPAEFHAQTALESAIRLHAHVKDKLELIDRIDLETHESAIRIIDKTGPLKNPADRDHCIQYIIAIGLIYGGLTAEHYEDDVASNPKIDELRSKIVVKENKQYTVDYLDPHKRSIANSVTITMKDGRRFGPETVEYPLGHLKRREEGIPLLKKKFIDNLSTRFDSDQVKKITNVFNAPETIDRLTVSELIDLFI